MSVSLTLGNFRNKADMQKKRADFFKTLNLQADLNRKYEESMIQRAQNERLGIQPMTGMPRSSEEGRMDNVGQQRIALGHLESIMNASQAMKALKELGMEDVKRLNTFWKAFSTQIKGITNIDADFFRRLFANFMKYVEESDELARPIPLRESTIKRLPQDLLDAWTQWSAMQIDPLTGRVAELDTLVRDTAEALSRSMQDMKREVKAETREVGTFVDMDQQDPSQERPTPRSRSSTISSIGSTSSVPPPSAAAQRLAAVSRAAQEQQRTRQKEVQMQDILNELGFRNLGSASMRDLTFEQGAKIYWELKENDLLSVLKKQAILALLKPHSIQSIGTIQQGLEELASLYPRSSKPSTFETETTGTGARRRKAKSAMPVAKAEEKKRISYRPDGSIRYARGLTFGGSIVSENEFVPFGKYVLNTDSLDTGVVHVRFPSLQPIQGVPQRAVSPQFVKVMYYILDNNMLHERLFNELSSSEQTYLTYLLQRSQMRKNLVKQERVVPTNEQTRRFELLRGIIKAGNNDPSVMSEMRSVLQRLIKT